MILLSLLLSCSPSISRGQKSVFSIHDAHFALKSDDYDKVREAINSNRDILSTKDYRGDTLLSLCLDCGNNGELKDLRKFILRKATSKEIATAFDIDFRKKSFFNRDLLLEVYKDKKDIEIFIELFNLVEDIYKLEVLSLATKDSDKFFNDFMKDKDLWPIFKMACESTEDVKMNRQQSILRNIQENNLNYTQYLQKIEYRLKELAKGDKRLINSTKKALKRVRTGNDSIDVKLLQFADWIIYFTLNKDIRTEDENIFSGEYSAPNRAIIRFTQQFIKKVKSWKIEDISNDDFVKNLNDIYDKNADKLDKVFGRVAIVKQTTLQEGIKAIEQ